MNLNNWLCKHFDIEKKGYVTIGDIGFFVVAIFILLFALFIIGLFFAAFSGLESPELEEGIYIIFIYSLRGWIYPILIIVSAVMLYFIIKYVSSIKVAKCPLKEKEQKKED